MGEKLTINHRIHDLRSKQKMSGEEFARELTESSGKQYTRSTVNNWEGTYRIKDDDIVNICKCFNVTADSLLFDEPSFKFRSTEKIVDEISAYTGLSHKAASALHTLHELDFDLEALNTLLERISFYFNVLPFIKDALKYCGSPISEDLSDDAIEAISLLSRKGFFVEPPELALGLLTAAAGSALSKELHLIDDEANYKSVKEFVEQNNESHLDDLRQLRDFNSKEGQ